MNTRERFVCALTGKDVDRVPFIKVFGGTNACLPHWEKDEPGLAQRIDELLQFEGAYRGWQVAPVHTGLSQVGPATDLEEDEEKILRRLGDGTVVVVQKGADYRSHKIEWPVKERGDWDRIKDEHLDPADPQRFPADWSAHVERLRNRDYPLQLTHGGVYGFARNLMGDEALAYAFYDDPDMVRDIMGSYTDMAIALYERMTAEVQFDLIECWEDMASKNGTLISPDMFRDFMAPQYRKLRAFADAQNIEIILVDSDGFIEDLVPLMLESGVNAMYPFEVQAGNDVAKMLDTHPQLGVVGGLDKQCMARGRAAIDAEMEKAVTLIRKGRFIPGPDHFVLSDVSWDNYRYFMERMREVVISTPAG